MDYGSNNGRQIYEESEWGREKGMYVQKGDWVIERRPTARNNVTVKNACRIILCWAHKNEEAAVYS